MLSFPDCQNVFSPAEDVTSSTGPIPNFERRKAFAGITDEEEERMKNISISSLNLLNSKLFHMSLNRLCGNDQPEQFMLEDFKKFSSKGMYKAVAIVDTDTDEEEKSSDKSDTD